jgi:hypothetical protein
MVKVLIDEKEYEGKVIVVKDYDNDIGFVDSKIFLFQSQDFIPIPKEIRFCKFLTDDTFALNIGNHYLFWDTEKKDWGFIAEPVTIELVDCILIPCKKKDLAPGEWAFRQVKQYPVQEEQYNVLYDYCLITKRNKLIIIEYDEKMLSSLTIFETECVNPDSFNWFKVMPKDAGNLTHEDD